MTNLSISYPEPDSQIKNKVLNLSSYATKKKLKHATGVDIFELAAKKMLLLWKLKLKKLDIYKLSNVQTSLNNLKAKVDN